MLGFGLKPQRDVGRRVDLVLSDEQNSLIDFKILLLPVLNQNKGVSCLFLLFLRCLIWLVYVKLKVMG